MSKLKSTIAICFAASIFGSVATEAQTPGARFPDALDVKLSRPNPLPFMKNPPQGDAELRQEIMDRAYKLFWSGKFAELERMAESFRTNDKRTPAGAWKIDLLYTSVFDCSCDNEDARNASGELHAKMLKLADEFTKQYPNSPTPRVIKAKILYAQAWRARGQGWGNEVKPSQWATFYDKIDAAMTLLANNEDIVARDPGASALAIELLSMTTDDKDFLDFVNSRMREFGPYTPIYFSAMRLYYPNWHDSPQVIEQMARGAVKASEKTEGKSLYARIYRHAYSEYGKDLYTATDVDKEYLRQAVNDLLTRYPDRHNFEMFGFMACHLEDWTMAAPIFARLQELPAQEYGSWGMEAPYQACRARMYHLQRAL